MGDYTRFEIGDTAEDRALFFQLLENEYFAEARKEAQTKAQSSRHIEELEHRHSDCQNQ
jgi:hypothetical protein